MGKNFSSIQSVVKNHESLSLKQMFDVTAQTVNNEEEIGCLDKILYGKNSWTQLSQVLERSGILQRTVHKEFGTILRKKSKLLEFAESGHPIFHATTPLSRGGLKSKGWGKLSVHFTDDQDAVDALFRIHFCQSAACLRSSGNYTWRIWDPSRWIGRTWDSDGSTILLGETKAEVPL